MLRKTLLLTAICMGLSLGATAETLRGSGGNTCGQYIELRKTQDLNLNSVLTAWSLGFLSSMNINRATLKNLEPVSLPDASTIDAYLDNYCRNNPLEKLWVANLKLFYDLEARN